MQYERPENQIRKETKRTKQEKTKSQKKLTKAKNLNKNKTKTKKYRCFKRESKTIKITYDKQTTQPYRNL